MSKIALSAPVAGVGTATIKGPETASDLEFQLPPRAGQVMVAGPVFYAYQSVAQTLTHDVYNTIMLQSEVFDVGGCFDTTTSRLQPNIAGYYFIEGQVAANVSAAVQTQAFIFKNGVEYASGPVSTVSGPFYVAVSSTVFFNGTTDYVELKQFYDGTATAASFTGQRTRMSGFLVRPA